MSGQHKQAEKIWVTQQAGAAEVQAHGRKLTAQNKIPVSSSGPTYWSEIKWVYFFFAAKKKKGEQGGRASFCTLQVGITPANRIVSTGLLLMVGQSWTLKQKLLPQFGISLPHSFFIFIHSRKM